jgi:serine/threonine-protein kinase
MDDRRWATLQTLFHHAADLDPDAQQAFIAAAAEDDAEMSALLATMLEQDRRGQPLLDGGVGSAAAVVMDRDHTPPGTRFGAYRATALLGEGGMGVVYKAERDDLGQTAAIKILKDAWLSPSRRERFVKEQRTLARLNHPSIASIYDADTLPDGTPWFVMEYVDGQPLTTHVRTCVPSIPGRLALFREVCEAVQHAHEHLIVHRDLKPSNILVKANGAVKLLDFGIAGQLDTDAHPVDRTLTAFRLLTPAYASPQQLRGEPSGVDGDVYSLGVILYELLTGVLPYDISGLTPSEAAALLSDRPPARPSDARRRLGAGRQGLPASAWTDLDVLCLTAMHAAPARRYRTAQALNRDVAHFLAGEPLDARPDALSYRAQKFVRRNRMPLSIAASAGGIVVGLAATYAVGLKRARNAATAEAARAQRILRFMLDLFQGGDPEAGPADDLRVTTLLERGLKEADALSPEPRVQVELYETLARMYQKLGRFEEADALFMRAWDRGRRVYGDAGMEVCRTMAALAELRADQAQYEEAERLSREALSLLERKLPSHHPLVAQVTRTLGRILQERGGYDAAMPVLERAVGQLDTGIDTVELANAIHELANARFYTGDYAASESLNARALDIYRRLLGDMHPRVGDTLVNLGAIEYERGRDAAAERLYREGLAITEAWYGPDHFRTANNLVMLGRALTRMDRLDEAAVVLRRALAGRERTYGPSHPAVASVLNEVGTIARKRGLLDEAESAYRRMAAIYAAVQGDRPHYLRGIATSNLGTVEYLRGNIAGAIALFEDALATFIATQGEDHANAAIARVKLGMALLAQHRYAEAEQAARAACDVLSRTMAPDAAWMIDARRTLASAYDGLGDHERAESFRAQPASDDDGPKP